jgi:hypothetical protein
MRINYSILHPQQVVDMQLQFVIGLRAAGFEIDDVAAVRHYRYDIGSPFP